MVAVGQVPEGPRLLRGSARCERRIDEPSACRSPVPTFPVRHCSGGFLSTGPRGAPHRLRGRPGPGNRCSSSYP